jgi:hypothetical protein
MPGVARTVLNHAVARLEQHFLAVVEFEPDFAAEHNVEIDGLRSVHTGVFRLENVGESGQFLHHFGEGRHEFFRRDGVRVRWHDKETEAVAVGRWKVHAGDGGFSVVWERGMVVAAPQAMEFISQNAFRRNELVSRHNGFSGRVVASDHTADIHECTPDVREVVDGSSTQITSRATSAGATEHFSQDEVQAQVETVLNWGRLLLDEVVWRPVIAWAQKFKFEQVESSEAPRSPILTLLRKSHLLHLVSHRVTRRLGERTGLYFAKRSYGYLRSRLHPQP